MRFHHFFAAIVVCAFLKPLPALAAIQVEISGLSDDLKSNVEAFLELETYADDEALTEATVRRAYKRAEKNIRDALRPFGYYDPTIKAQLSRTEQGWAAKLEIDPGRPVLLTVLDVRISGEAQTDPVFIELVNQSGLTKSQPIRHDYYDKLKQRLVELAAERGFFEAELTRHELIVDPSRYVAEVHLHLNSGPRYRVGTITVFQDFLRNDVVTRGITIEEGEYFDASRIRETEYALYDMGYFMTVEIIPTPDPHTREASIEIRLTPTRRHRWTVGGGYSTDTQIYVRAGWENRIANRHGHRMGLNIRLSEIKQDLLYRYIIPHKKPNERLTILTGFIREKRGDTRSNRFEIAPIDTAYWGQWQRDLFGIVQAEVSDIAERTFDDVWLIPGLRALRATWDNPTNPSRGYKLAPAARGSLTELGSKTDYLQLHLRSAAYVPVTPKWRFYLRGEIGATAVDDFSVLPASQRFFAGGDRSVRGYGFNELSPVDEDGNKIGGRNLVFGSVELEFDVRPKWTIDTFFDFGNAVDSFSDPLEYSAGIGMRWRSPLGLIGADIAQSLSEPELGPRLHLSIRPEL